jgi:hypothetical protein
LSGANRVSVTTESIFGVAPEIGLQDDDNRSHKPDQKTVFDQTLALFFLKETVQHGCNVTSWSAF